jgi:hypothetical protein
MMSMSQQPSVPESAVDKARLLVEKHSSCFVAWSRDARVQSIEDVWDVIFHLRTHGGHGAWKDAQALVRCL